MEFDWLYEDKCKGCLFLKEDNIMGATCHWCKFKNEQINVDKVSQCEHKFTLKESKQYQKFIEDNIRLQKENQELKEQHEKDFKIMCKQAYLLNNKNIDSPIIEKYQSAIEILKMQTSIENIKCENGNIYIVNIGDISVLITQQEYDLLKEVLENE